MAGNNYLNPMDRDYFAEFAKNMPRIAPNQLSRDVSFMTNKVVEAFQKHIFGGASKGELIPWGFGKSGEQPSPEAISKTEREELRNLALLNKMETSTHASPRLMGLSGFKETQFLEAARKESVDEIKRAIDFAADATTGGAVVVHFGEFSRPTYQGEDFFKKSDMFGPTKEEEEKMGVIYYAVDRRDGKLMMVPGKKEFMIPVLTTDGQYDIDKETGEYKTEKLSFQKFRERYEKEGHKKYEDNPSEAFGEFFKKMQEAQILQSKGHAKEYEYRRREIRDRIEDIKEKVEKTKNNPEIPNEIKGQMIKQLEKEIPFLEETQKSYQHLVASSEIQLKEIDNTVSNLKDLREYTLEKTGRSLAELGIHAMTKSKQAVENMPESYKKTFKPIFVAPENIFSETYGGSPDEMRDLIKSGREQMVKMLEPQYGDKKAADLAKQHIKATLDLGHLNTWYRHFKGSKDEEQNRAMFKEWFVGKVKELAAGGILGHIHITDNLGYWDEHLAMGQGKAPIKEALQALKEEAPELMKELVVESGGGNLDTVLPQTWTALGSPIYSLDKATGKPYFSSASYFDVHHTGYFARAGQVPYFSPEYQSTKEYLTENFWSGTGLE